MKFGPPEPLFSRLMLLGAGASGPGVVEEGGGGEDPPPGPTALYCNNTGVHCNNAVITCNATTYTP